MEALHAEAEGTTGDLVVQLAGLARARDLLSRHGLAGLSLATEAEIVAEGLTPLAARRLLSAFELGRRLACRPLRRGDPWRSSRDIFDAFHARMRDLKVERFMMVTLDAKNRVLGEALVSQGSLTSSLVHPREVFRIAIRAAAVGVVLVHNHPSGDCEPSPEDQDITRRLAGVGELVGIRVLDHVVIGDGAYVSFRDRGWILA